MTTIKFRRDTSANWTSVNPIPAQGEPCYETDTGKLKIGNGSNNYVTLPYVSDGGGSAGDLPIATATTLGGVKIGNNLSITEDGTLSATGGSTPTNMVTTDTDQTISGVKTFTSNIVAKSAANLKLNDAGNKKTVSLSTDSGGYLKVGCTGTSLSEFISMWDNSNNLLDIAPTYLRTRTSGGTEYEYINSQNIDTTYMKWDDTSKKLKVDTAAVAGLAMPSGTSVDLTLGASGATYTAPADGYISISAVTNYTGWIKVDTRPGCYGYANNGQFLTNTPVVKNISFKIWYNFSSGDVSRLQCAFYYCNGTTP